MEILPMTEQDIKKLALLDKACFSRPWSENSFREELQNDIAVYYVAHDGERVVGYAGLWRICDSADITNIAVLKEYRRQGIATALLKALIKKARELEMTSLTLEVRETNKGAIELYRSFGFEIIGRRKRFYQDPEEDALIMIKRID